MKVGSDDMLFDWVSFATSAGMLFGLFPGYILYCIGEKKSILMGGFIVVCCELTASKIINGEDNTILMNGTGACATLCAVAG